LNVNLNLNHPAASTTPRNETPMNHLMTYNIVATFLATAILTAAAEPPALTRNSPAEPIAKAYSADQAVAFVEQSTTHWQKKRRCVTCHTNGLHLIAGASVTPNSKVLIGSQDFARNYLSGYVEKRATAKNQHGAIEGLVSTAAFLAISEMTTLGKLTAKTEAALDHIWRQQDKSGAWEDWLKCNWGPYEVDDHWGVTLAAVALAMAPQSYRSKSGPAEAQRRMHAYLTASPPNAAHQKAMMLWLSRYAPEVITSDQKRQWIQDLRDLQQNDGGWVLIQLGDADWKRGDNKEQAQISDGYATAKVIFALRQAGVPADDPAIRRGIKWLKSNQRQSGRWFTHSPHIDGKHYITQAATNMALLALASCDALR
jgi:squalene-hopene/tetraprenyl-beta-curcumene cyclase